jgi:hypothetical protein
LKTNGDENYKFEDERRVLEYGDKPRWGKCTADEAFVYS